MCMLLKLVFYFILFQEDNAKAFSGDWISFVYLFESYFKKNGIDWE